ncbi:hypothetical protein M8J77_009181 [Diaphorina citri]|nr:hypothetical protein M8J77_009181 [Diaphorina citri]
MEDELPILKSILKGNARYHNAPVRFGRVPKREKARILAAMQQSTNTKCTEKALAAELDDEQRMLSTVVRAHLDTCAFTADKIEPMLRRAREHPTYTACPSTLISISSLVWYPNFVGVMTSQVAEFLGEF